MLATTTGPVAVTSAKRQMHRDWLATTPAASVAESKRALDEAMGTAEYREGIAAFAERRPPKF
jgi:enoyl-CoA hydratase/carnithine racemase